MTRLMLLLAALLVAAPTAGAAKPPPGGQLARIAYVVDGDTVDLTNQIQPIRIFSRG